MKQRITPEQLAELTEEQKGKFCEIAWKFDCPFSCWIEGEEGMKYKLPLLDVEQLEELKEYLTCDGIKALWGDIKAVL